MIQDIAPHIYHNEYLPHHPQKDSVLLCYDKDRIFMNVTDGEITFPTYAEAEAVYPAVRDMWTYLFTKMRLHITLYPGSPLRRCRTMPLKRPTACAP